MSPKQGSATTNTKQKDPEEIQAEIDETREELGDTAEALAGKADIKGQAKAKVDETKQNAQQKAEELASKAQENPVPAAIAGAFVAGVLVGRILSR